jgi:hypothetical protein
VRAAATNDVSYTADGWHTLEVTAAEANCDTLALDAVCVTADRFVQPVSYDLAEGASGSGLRTVTVTVRTAGGVVYEGVKVTVNNQTETGSALVVYTDENGQAICYLNDGPWRVLAAANGYQGGGATNFTVNGPEAVVVTVVATTLPAAAAAGYCTVYCAEETQNGEYPTGKFWITGYKSPATRTSGAVTVDITYGPDEEALSVTTGQASLQILQGAVVSLRMKTEDQTLEKTDVVVPAETGPVNWNDLVAEA